MDSGLISAEARTLIDVRKTDPVHIVGDRERATRYGTIGALPQRTLGGGSNRIGHRLVRADDAPERAHLRLE